MKEANIEIEKAANMKSDFLANMSHELRTPMNAVIGMAEMALREDMTPTAKNYINQIKTAGKSLLTIINDILDFSKIESGKMDISEVEYEPLSMINDITSIISTRIDKDDVEFVLDINPNIPKTLYGDNIRLKQIIINLSNNAAKFTKTGQVLLKFDFEPAGGNNINLLFSVKDTGIGIKKEDMEKIFQSFQQVDSKRNRNIEGTGLGLAISKQLLALMGGNINVESVYGEGSTFSFTVPQRIVDSTPSISLNDDTPTNALACLSNDFAHAQLKRDLTRLGINFTDLHDTDVLSFLEDNASSLGGTYLFISQKDFTDPIREFMKNNPSVNAVVVVPYDMSINYEMDNVLVARKPLSSVSITAIYNNETLNQYEDNSSDEYYNFTAETAKILIVDDNAINLTVAEGLLEPLNMQIDTALSGNDAINKISNQMYDLILMDHMMPELDGIETTHIIRRFHPEYEHVPIIALTANAVGDAQKMFLAEGLNDFVAKPIEVRMLVTAIHKWLPKEKIKVRTVSTKKSAASSSVKLPDIPELDIEGAVKLVGSEKLFMTILADYYRAIPKKLELIKKYKEAGDWHNYTVEVHALKSASRQIGANELSQKAAALEAAGNANDIDTIMRDTDEVISMYTHYYEILKPVFPDKKETGNKPSIPKTVLLGLFDDMMTAINDLDMDKMEAVINKLDEYHFEGDDEKLYKRLCDAVGDMDPDVCEEVIHAWKSIT
jgi:CheY-like chemotaxis protein/HPt (histidine-containing phosphotransfer) domain-containing protein